MLTLYPTHALNDNGDHVPMVRARDAYAMTVLRGTEPFGSAQEALSAARMHCERVATRHANVRLSV